MSDFDVGPVVVSGRFRASKARVIYSEGHLFVFQSATRHAVFDTDEPVQSNGTTTAQLTDGSGAITFRQAGCNCGYSLGSIPRDRLLATIPAATSP